MRSPAAKRPALEQRCIVNAVRAVQQALEKAGAADAHVSLVPDPAVARTAGRQRIVYVHQYHSGIPVDEAIVTVTCDGSGRVAGMNGTLRHLPNLSLTAASVSPAAAVALALSHVKAVKTQDAVAGKKAPTVVARISLPTEPTLVQHRACRDPALLHLTWTVGERGRVQLAWRILLMLKRERDFELLISAVDQDKVLHCIRATHCVGASATVLDPYGTLPASPLPMPRPLLDYPADSSNVPQGFPWDWVDDVQTSGLNARSGTTGQCRPIRGVPAAGVVEFSAATEDERRVLHAFYWCNFLHDFFYLYGFDEAAGNYQKRSLRPGGRSGDPVWALVMSTPDKGLAWVGRVPDGVSPRIVLHSHVETLRHTALDADILIHEYTHAVVERLCGGRLSWVAVQTPQGLALAEGYSDFFALSLRLYDAPAGASTSFASYVSNNTDGGLRNQPYGANFRGTFASLGTPGFRTAHEAGQVWAACLLAVAETLGATIGDRRRGVRMTWRIVIDSVRRLPTGTNRPTWLDARDALLSSLEHVSRTGDFTNTNLATLVDAVVRTFSRFGMGPGARSPTTSFSGLIASF